MRVLVTGGAGFIGSHLTDALLARGDDVVVLDSLAGGGLGNLDSAGTHPRFRFVHGSVLDELVVYDRVLFADVVVHLARPYVDARRGVDLVDAVTTMVRGAEVVLSAANRYQRRVVVASTADVYDDAASAPLVEGADQVFRPAHSGGSGLTAAKALEEALVSGFHHGESLQSTVMRIFPTVGPRCPSRPGTLRSLLGEARANRPLKFLGESSNACALTHVSDVVDAFVRVMDHPGAVGGTFNVGAPSEGTLSDLATAILALTGSASEVRFVSSAVDADSAAGVFRPVSDSTELERMTGWCATRRLEGILREACMAVGS